VTAAKVAAIADDRSQELYEEIRCHAVTSSALGGRLGMVVLLREGLVAWLAGRRICSDSVESRPHDWQVGAAAISDEIQACMVRVLASMALGGHYNGPRAERNP
jgi:hypothetical protein